MGTSMDPIPWKSINGTRGISKAVTLDGNRSINTFIIQGPSKRCDEYGVLRRLNEIIATDRIKIERGPFAEFICTVDQIKNDQRAWVLIDILQQQARAEVSLDDVSKINWSILVETVTLPLSHRVIVSVPSLVKTATF